MNVGNLKIGTRLGAGFSIVLLLLLAIAAIGISRMTLIQGHMETINKVNDVQSQLVINMRDTVTDRMIALRNVVILTEDSEMKPEVQRVKAQTVQYTENERKFSRMLSSQIDTKSEKTNAMIKLRESEAAAAPVMDKVIELGLANRNAEATKVLINELRPIQKKWMETLSELVAFEATQNDQAVANAEQAYSDARNLMLILTGVAIILGSGIAWFITRGITKPIIAAVKVAQTVAAGDLTSRIDASTRDETGQLLQALKDMNNSLIVMIGEVRIGTDSIATASSQIAAGNLDLSSRTEQQAASLEETASSMEEMTDTVKQNADNARQANQLAVSASDVAIRGGVIVSQVVDTMDSINESAKKIVDIIGVIDSIAFQTNILALNAAVEAARAGEEGRGFAVVASEVRNLAQRSAAAAKEIKTLIHNSVEKVDAGAKLVDQAGSAMDEIVDSVKRVTDIMGEISAASHEQTTGIEQINQAVAQMDQVTQQNAALVEEAAAAADALHDQAGHLVEVVSVFKLDACATPESRPPAEARQPGEQKGQRAETPRRALPPRPATHRLAMVPGYATDPEWEQF